MRKVSYLIFVPYGKLAVPRPCVEKFGLFSVIYRSYNSFQSTVFKETCSMPQAQYDFGNYISRMKG